MGGVRIARKSTRSYVDADLVASNTSSESLQMEPRSTQPVHDAGNNTP